MNSIRAINKKKFAWAATLALCAFSAGLLIAHKSFADFNRNYTISHAASIYMTARGQQYFSQNKLMGILQRGSLQGENGDQRTIADLLAHEHLAHWEYDSDAAFDLNHLPDGLRPYQSTLNFMRGTLHDWIIGYSFNNPLFHVKVREAGYDLDGLDINLRVDPELTANLQDNGVAVILDVTIPHLRVYAQDICGFDSNNSFLGTCRVNRGNPRRYDNGFGVYNASIELADSNPLRLSVPVRVQILPGGSLQIEALNITTNLEKLRFNTRQDRDFILPSVQVQVGNRTSSLNPEPLEAALLSRERDLVQLGLHHLQDFVVQELPGRLTNMAFDSLQQGFETVKTIDPPGIDTFHDGSRFQWGCVQSA